MKFLLIACFVLVMTATSLLAADAELLSVEKIWDKGPHNAFTDLLRWKDRWYCVFRESEAHVDGNGKLRVLVSADATAWESIALVAESGVDLRDPKLSIASDGRLMMVVGGSFYEGKTLKSRHPRVMFSKDGIEWTPPHEVLEQNDWLWRVTWHDGVCYGVSYNEAARAAPAAKAAAATGNVPAGPADWKLKLVSSTDGENFTLVTYLQVPGHADETTVRFLADGRMAAFVRREGGDKAAWVGTSEPPYKEWSWKPLSRSVGGPNFIQIPDGRLVAVSRKLSKGATMVLSWLDVDKGTLNDVLTLPSGGDTSYAGLVWDDGVLWVSYYSSHEQNKTSIYLAKVKLVPIGK